ncbi:MAG TPA: hypothetical protein VET85_09830 [Stellaceae bacterium]|nr:hypothetical protein [Stellaceae bacterium]
MTQAAQHRAQVSRGRKSLHALLALALAGGVWLGAAQAIFALQGMRCPAGTFYWDSPAPQHVFVYLPLLVPALALLSFVLAYSSAAGRRSRRRLRRHFVVLAAALLLALPASFAVARCQFCLLPSRLLVAPTPWSDLREYAWQDVAAVETSCWHGRSGWNAGYVLTLRDGTAFDIMGSQQAAAPILPAVAQALHGHGVAFDARRVALNCDALVTEWLRRAP